VPGMPEGDREALVASLWAFRDADQRPDAAVR